MLGLVWGGLGCSELVGDGVVCWGRDWRLKLCAERLTWKIDIVRNIHGLVLLWFDETACGDTIFDRDL